MRMLPFLLITLHFSQIGLTDDLTFTAKSSFLIQKAPIYGVLPLFSGAFPKVSE
jgi:hypothetical protein